MGGYNQRAMPIVAILHILITITCVVHIVRTGRPQIWIYIIVLMPMIGMLAYVATEIVPELFGTRTARRAVAEAKRALDPDKAYRDAKRALDISPTVHNRRVLADTCVERGAYDEAIGLYRDCLVGVTSDAPDIMAALGRAQFRKGDMADTVATLDALKSKNPDYHAPDMHMIYARALEALGREEEALEEFAALAGYASGEEARCRYGLLLKKHGRAADADKLFREILRVPELAPKRYAREQREWIDTARANLSG